MIKIFGTALDPLDISERVAVKIAYLNWLRSQPTLEDQFLDPYCYFSNHLKERNPATDKIEWIGAFPVESWLTPKPLVADLKSISQEKYTGFLDQNGCFTYYRKLIEYLSKNVGAGMPVMIGVDHCMTGAVLAYLKKIYSNYNVIIFDSHCDLVDWKTWRTYFLEQIGRSRIFSEEKNIYECGSFLCYLLKEEIIYPENLWIIGAQDIDQLKINDESLYAENVLPWIKRGLHIISKEEVVRHGIPDEIEGRTYVSFDMDLGSIASVLATRFVNHTGLTTDDFFNLICDLSERIKTKKIELIGLDIMEIDIHFLGAEIGGNRDYTEVIATAIIDEMIYNQFR